MRSVRQARRRRPLLRLPRSWGLPTPPRPPLSWEVLHMAGPLHRDREAESLRPALCAGSGLWKFTVSLLQKQHPPGPGVKSCVTSASPPPPPENPELSPPHCLEADKWCFCCCYGNSHSTCDSWKTELPNTRAEPHETGIPVSYSTRLPPGGLVLLTPSEQHEQEVPPHLPLRLLPGSSGHPVRGGCT